MSGVFKPCFVPSSTATISINSSATTSSFEMRRDHGSVAVKETQMLLLNHRDKRQRCGKHKCFVRLS